MNNSAEVFNEVANNIWDKGEKRDASFVVALDVLSLLIAVAEIMSLCVLGKCVLISEQIRIILQSILIADLLFHMTNVLMPIVLLDFEYNIAIIYISRLKLYLLHLFVLVYYFSMVITTVDRLVAIKYPVKYKLIFPTSTVKKMIKVVWIVLLPLFLIPNIYNTVVNCLLNADLCEKYAYITDLFQRAIAACLLICDVLVITCYLSIYYIARHHFTALRQRYASTRAHNTLPAKRIMIIVGTFVVLYSPFIFFTAIFDLFGVNASIEASTIFYVFGIRIPTSVHSVISLYYYLYSMPECRMVFLKMFLSWNKQCNSQREEIKSQLFHLPVSSPAGSSGTSSSSVF